MYVRTLERPGLGLGQPSRALQALSLMFRSKVIPAYKDMDGNFQSTDCSVYVPRWLRNEKSINLLVFFHGDDSCAPKHNFNPYKVVKNFDLDGQVDRGQRNVALAVPVVYWKVGTSDNIRGVWSAAHLNAFVEEVLDQIGSCGVRPGLNSLILAGHSHAHGILTPLADEFEKGVSDTTKGALAKLWEVWSLDTTYGTRHALALKKWADKLGTVQFMLVLSQIGYDERRNDCKLKRGDPPIKYWDCAIEKPKVKLPPNLDNNVTKVRQGHCELPKTWIENLLFVMP